MFEILYTLLVLYNYVMFGLVEGDWLNDWLTHLPEIIQKIVEIAS